MEVGIKMKFKGLKGENMAAAAPAPLLSTVIQQAKVKNCFSWKAQLLRFSVSLKNMAKKYDTYEK